MRRIVSEEVADKRRNGQKQGKNRQGNMIEVAVLAVPGCLHSAVYGVGEILEQANGLHNGFHDGPDSGLGDSPLFRCSVLSPDGEPVDSFTGTRIGAAAALADVTPDILVLPPIIGSVDRALRQEQVIARLADLHATGKQIATICAGSFLLAETGLLDKRAATTHWMLAEQFRTRYPAVDLQIERLLVDGGDYICAGGVSAWMDLALHLVARYAGRETALQCAKIMLMDPHREYQTPYGLGGFRKNHGDAAVLKAQSWLETHHAEALRVRDMAQQAALGEKTFLRRFRAATGKTPLQYLQQLRIQAAQTLLESTDKNVEQIAESVGYADYSAFRKLFKRILGSTPSAYRQRFALPRHCQ